MNAHSMCTLVALLASSEALTLSGRAAPSIRARATTPVAQLSLGGLFGNKKAAEPVRKSGDDDATLNAILAKDQKEWTREDRKNVDRISSNWANERKVNQEGCPRTGRRAQRIPSLTHQNHITSVRQYTTIATPKLWGG